MTQLDVGEASKNLADLIARVRAGEEVVIEERGQPAVRMVLAESSQRKRLFGEFEGNIVVSDDFNIPLSEDELAEWEK